MFLFYLLFALIMVVDIFVLKVFLLWLLRKRILQSLCYNWLIVFILVFTLIVLLQSEKSLFLLCSFARQKNQKRASEYNVALQTNAIH